MTSPLSRRPAAWALVAVLVAAPATAAPWKGELATPELQALGESGTLGPLTVLLQENALPEHGPADPRFRLEADRLRVEADHTDLNLNLLVTEYFHDVKTSVEDHADAVVEGTVNRDGHRFSVWPVTASPPTVHASEPGCATLSPSTQAEVNRTALVRASTRPASVAHVGSSTLWSGCDEGSVTVTGDFLLRLWEWDAELTADGETRTLPSGEHGVDGQPRDDEGTDRFAGEATEQYLYAHNATLTIPRLAGHYEVYLGDAEVTATALRLRQATGTIKGTDTHRAQSQDVYLQGDLVVHARNTGGMLATTFQGGLDQAHLDGVAATLTPGGGGPPEGTWPLLATLAVLTVVGLAWREAPLAAYHLNRVLGGDQGSLAPASRRERRGVGYWVLSRIGNHLGWHRRSRRHAVQAHKRFPLLPEAKLMVAVAESHLGRHEAALVDFADAYTRLQSPTARAMAACAAAEASCRLGDPDLAREWLRDATRNDPAFTLGRVRRRRFESLSDQDWFDPWWRLLAQRAAGPARD